ncbi:MAG TPA: BatA domain-containing protein, partial [Tepidisphaeraceae bacterium]
MAFLNPFMLLGIAAVSVPIVIHLLNKRKFERVVWAAMRFLRISVEQNQRRIKIEDILLLILRCVLLALLALALARPALRGANAGIFGQAKVTAVVVIDNSYSMSQSDGVMSRMDRAKKAAEQVLDTLPAGSSTAVLLASDVVKGAIPEPTFDLNLARKVIHEAP